MVGQIRDIKGIEVVDDTERHGFAFQQEDGRWVAYTSHPMFDHPLLGTFETAAGAYREIEAAELRGNRAVREKEMVHNVPRG